MRNYFYLFCEFAAGVDTTNGTDLLTLFDTFIAPFAHDNSLRLPEALVDRVAAARPTAVPSEGEELLSP